jgi:hypothetical protein
MVTAGIISPMIMLEAGSTAGAKTDCWDSPTASADGSRYFDVQIEYAKAGPDDLLIRIRASNRGPEPAHLHILPTLWFRNAWAWQPTCEALPKPRLHLETANAVYAEHNSLGNYHFAFDTDTEVLFTENETNANRLWGTQNSTGCAKDAFHEYVIARRLEAVNAECAAPSARPTINSLFCPEKLANCGWWISPAI